MNITERINKILKQNEGIITTKEVEKEGIGRQYLSLMCKKGTIERIQYGVYMDVNSFRDEFYNIQLNCKNGIFSYGTALYLHGLTDRMPLKCDLTVPSGYNAKLLKDLSLKFHYIKIELHGIGMIEMQSPYGRIIKVYDKERTICDIIKNEKKIDIQIFTQTLKECVKCKNIDIDKLSKYSKIFKVEKQVHEYMDVLL